MGLLSVWWIYVVAFLNSALSICFDTANFAAVPGLVRQEDLVTANGRIQAGYSMAKVGGPLLGGLVIERTDQVALVYAVIGLLIFGISLMFCLTPLSHADRYLPKY